MVASRLSGRTRAFQPRPRAARASSPAVAKNRIVWFNRGGWWAEIETKGEIAHGFDAVSRRLRAVPATWARAVPSRKTSFFPAMAARHTDMPVVPEGARSSDDEHQFYPWRAKGKC